MTDIVVRTLKGPIDAVLETPSGTGPWPGVLIVHDGLGQTDDNRAITRRVADNGYLALAPDLYSRGGFLRCVKRVMHDLLAHRGRTFDDLLAARDVLADHHSCTGVVGVAGFCLGGGYALVLAGRGFAASAPFYPSLPPAHYEHVLDEACPVVASLGERDPLLRGAGPKLEHALMQRGVVHDVKSYDGVGHGFANKMPLQPLERIIGFGYDHDATEHAWARVFSFFGAHLGD